MIKRFFKRSRVNSALLKVENRIAGMWALGARLRIEKTEAHSSVTVEAASPDVVIDAPLIPRSHQHSADDTDALDEPYSIGSPSTSVDTRYVNGASTGDR